MSNLQVPHNPGPGILIGLPTLGRPVPMDWAFAFKSLNPPINFNTIFHVINGAPIAEARNEMVKNAIDKNCKYLFFLGDDVVVPNHTLRQLIYRLEQDREIDIVGGVYCAKAEPCFPLVFQGNGQGSYWDWKIGEFFQCTGLGMDCTLLRVETLKAIEGPWFKTIDKDNFLDGDNSAESWTEDLYFFHKLFKEKEDAKVFCDASVICDHWDVYGKKAYKLPYDSLPMRQRVITKNKKGLSIKGANGFALDYDIVKVPEDYRCQLSNLPFEKDNFDEIRAPGNAEFNKELVEEYLRVLKPDGKLIMKFHEFFNVPVISLRLKQDLEIQSEVEGLTLTIQKSQKSEVVCVR